MVSSSQFKQEMPPPGGYSPITTTRVYPKSYFGGWALIGGYLGVTAASAYLYHLNCKSLRAEEVEHKGATFALYPMLLAERDRAFLKQVRKNRDEETDLMKNVEGWKTGTWYGEPIYHTVDKDTLLDMKYQEYYIHASYKDFKKRAYLPFLS